MLAESTNNPRSQWNEHLFPASESISIRHSNACIRNQNVYLSTGTCQIRRKGKHMSERLYLSILKDEPEVLTVIEVAKILRIGKNKAYDRVNGGRLSSIKVGGKTIVPKMCLVTFLLDTNNYQLNPV